MVVFDMYMIFGLCYISVGHTHRCQLAFKKKIQVKSPSPESRIPETGSDLPIGSDRDSRRDRK